MEVLRFGGGFLSRQYSRESVAIDVRISPQADVLCDRARRLQPLIVPEPPSKRASSCYALMARWWGDSLAHNYPACS